MSVVGPYSTAPGPRRKTGALVVWAEDGVVFIEDQKDGVVTVLTQATTRSRLHQFLAELAVWDRRRCDADPIERAGSITKYHELKQMCEVLDETVKEAFNQGDHNDDEVRKRKLREFLRSRRSNMNNADGLVSPNKVIELLYAGVNGPIHIPVGRSAGRPVVVAPPALPPGYRRG